MSNREETDRLAERCRKSNKFLEGVLAEAEKEGFTMGEVMAFPGRLQKILENKFKETPYKDKAPTAETASAVELFKAQRTKEE